MHDAAIAPAHHRRQHRPGDPEGRVQIHLDLLGPFGIAGAVEQGGVVALADLGHAGVVHQNIDPAQGLAGIGDEKLGRTRRRQIGDEVRRAFETARVATWYPGPAGITDSELDDAAWAALAAATPLAEQLVPHVEALLVYTPRSAPPRGCYLVPVTAAYELAGQLRATWQGFAGGSETEAALAAFFAELDVRGGKR